MLTGKVFEGEQQAQPVRGEKVDVKDSQALMSSSVKLIQAKQTKLKYSWSVDVSLQGC